jgi:hypothetical protein
MILSREGARRRDRIPIRKGHRASGCWPPGQSGHVHGRVQGYLQSLKVHGCPVAQAGLLGPVWSKDVAAPGALAPSDTTASCVIMTCWPWVIQMCRALAGARPRRGWWASIFHWPTRYHPPDHRTS